MTNPIDFSLLDRVLSGEATAEERAELARRAAQDAGLRQLLDALPEAVRSGSAHSWDTDLAWGRLATLTRSGRLTRVWQWRSAAIAAVLVLGLGTAYTFRVWRERSARQEAIAEQVYRTGVGERRTLQLRDGSTVTLAPMSVLRVSLAAEAPARAVQLEGQAFFEVVPDSAHPFTVLTRNASTRVLGTSFTVSEYASDRSAEVVVVSGRVAFGSRRGAGRPAVLERGQAGRIGEDGALVVRANIDLNEHVAWTSGRLVFRAQRFAELLPALARWYGADIQLADPSLADTRVTALFEGQTLDEVLEVLAETVGARYQRAGNRITFSR